MFDVFADDVKCVCIVSKREGYRIDFKNDKDESVHVVLDNEAFTDLYYKLKNRCETQGLVPIYGEGGAEE